MYVCTGALRARGAARRSAKAACTLYFILYTLYFILCKVHRELEELLAAQRKQFEKDRAEQADREKEVAKRKV